MPVLLYNFNRGQSVLAASEAAENGKVGRRFQLETNRHLTIAGLTQPKKPLAFFGFDLETGEWQVAQRMDADEREICLYLKGWPSQFVSVAEITRRAGGKRRGRHEPNWAIPVLTRLVEKGILESDSTGHYRLIRRTKQEKKKRWVSPHIQKILEKSGKSFEGVFEVNEDDDLPEHLKDL